MALFLVNGGRVRVSDSRCFVEDVVATMPADAAIVSWWSMATPIWYTQAVEGRRPDLTVVSAGRTVVDEIEWFRAQGRPVVIIQLEGELRRAQEAGYPMDEVELCGSGAWLITGPAGSAPAPTTTQVPRIELARTVVVRASDVATCGLLPRRVSPSARRRWSPRASCPRRP
jgi:hypothetical protein